MPEYTATEVARLIGYLMRLWPGYARWDTYADPKVGAAWADIFNGMRLTPKDTIAGTKTLVTRVQRDRQWPPSVSEIVDASLPFRRERERNEASAQREQDRIVDEQDRIVRIRRKLHDEGEVIQEEDPDRYELLTSSLARLEEHHPDV